MTNNALRACLMAGLLLICPAAAMAKSYTIPNPNPVAVITLPDDWESTEIEKGVESQSDDDEVYVAIEVTELKDAAKAIADTIIWLKGKKVEIDPSTQAQKAVTINDMIGSQVTWSGKDEDGPVHISLTLLQVTDTKGLVLTYWASPDGEKENLKDLVSILDSLKAVK